MIIVHSNSLSQVSVWISRMPNLYTIGWETLPTTPLVKISTSWFSDFTKGLQLSHYSAFPWWSVDQFQFVFVMLDSIVSYVSCSLIIAVWFHWTNHQPSQSLVIKALSQELSNFMVIALYSASALDRATTACFLLTWYQNHSISYVLSSMRRINWLSNKPLTSFFLDWITNIFV